MRIAIVSETWLPQVNGVSRTLEELARATFRACHARDYARVDIRIDGDGSPFVLELNSMASLGAGGSFVRAARAAGYAFGELVNRIADVAYIRCFGVSPAVEHVVPRSRLAVAAHAAGR